MAIIQTEKSGFSPIHLVGQGKVHLLFGQKKGWSGLNSSSWPPLLGI
jgi:hypothetical protein